MNGQMAQKATQASQDKPQHVNRYDENFKVSRQKGGRVSLFGSAIPVKPIIVNMPEDQQ